MIMISIAPLSVNRCWQGRKYKTPEYKVYEQELLLKLARYNLDIPSKIKLTIEAGISVMMDIDNIAKPIIDILQKRYKFKEGPRVSAGSLEEVLAKTRRVAMRKF